MRIILLLALFNLGSLYTHAQTSFGVTAGFGTATEKWGGKLGDGVSSKFQPSFRAGVIADIKLARRLYLQPQLLFSTKGSRSFVDGLDSSVYYLRNITYKTRLAYIELPVNVVYKHPLRSGKLVAGLGGYIAHGLYGKYKSDGYNPRTGTTIHYEQDVKFLHKIDHSNPDEYLKYSQYKPIDAGINLIAGYELQNGVSFNVNYTRGLTRTGREMVEFDNGSGIGTGKRTNSYFGISVVYVLKKHTSKA